MTYAASSLGVTGDWLTPVLSVIPSEAEMKRRAIELGYDKAWAIVAPSFQCDTSDIIDCDTQKTFFQMGFELAWGKAHSEWVGGRIEDVAPPNLTEEQIREEIERARSQPGFDRLNAPTTPAAPVEEPASFPTGAVVVSVVAVAAIAAMLWSKP